MSRSVWSGMSRDGKIGAVYRLAKQNFCAAEIAEKLGTHAPHVSALAREEGIVIARAVDVRHARQQQAGPDQEPAEFGNIWSKSDADRRMAFWKRAKRAAREALRDGQAQFPTLSTLTTTETPKPTQ